MADYAEDIFDRSESRFFSTSSQLAWLRGFENPKAINKYTRDGARVYNDLLSSKDIEIKINSAKDVDALYQLDGDIANITIDKIKGNVQGLYNNKLSVLEREQEKAEEKERKEAEKKKIEERKEKEKLREESEDRRKRANAERNLERLREQEEEIARQEREEQEEIARQEEALNIQEQLLEEE